MEHVEYEYKLVYRKYNEIKKNTIKLTIIYIDTKYSKIYSSIDN